MYPVLYIIYNKNIWTRVAQWVRSLDLTAHTSLSSIRHGFVSSFVNYKKGCTRLTAASDKVYQLLAQGQRLSLGTPASSITKTGRHDIAEILLKVALNTKNQINYNKNMKSKWMQTERIQSDDSHIDLWSMRTKNSSLVFYVFDIPLTFFSFFSET